MANNLRSMARNDQNFWIHDTWDGVLHDEYRLRAFVSDAESQSLSEYFERYCKSFLSLPLATEWRFLKTMGGAQDQPVRREFAPPTKVASANVCSVPGSILVATQDRAYVYGYGWNNHVALRSTQQIIELNKGDVLLSRGDFAFVAAGHSANHVCVHGYIDTPLYPRPRFPQPEMASFVDDTPEVEDFFCFMWNCPFSATDPDTLRKHLNRYHRFFFNRSRTLTTLPVCNAALKPVEDLSRAADGGCTRFTWRTASIITLARACMHMCLTVRFKRSESFG
ncbi:hypothetical protein PI124_g6062 [Phytophthora idaei]|nr:hypothetical protein PI125_g7110 [Phytophthora idaei]KAG3156826.1 hypothetical protein PI126_g8603 [Phytophthora idaei]KAG3249278.1 hypothetical protein PI124_g6062 [Phytophthora idaei]